jgi:hypothetical protein
MQIINLLKKPDFYAKIYVRVRSLHKFLNFLLGLTNLPVNFVGFSDRF